MAKLRGKTQRRDPGGGGINVARVIRRLGGDARAIYPVGGAIGKLLRQLLDQEGVASHTWTIAGETRENFFVDEISAGKQYRFILPGPRLHESEWKECLKLVSALEPFPRYLVASGSLPDGVPEDFYAQVARIAKQRGARFVLDTSGPALAAAVAEGVDLIKPNLREMRELTGSESIGRLRVGSCRKGPCRNGEGGRRRVDDGPPWRGAGDARRGLARATDPDHAAERGRSGRQLSGGVDLAVCFGSLACRRLPPGRRCRRRGLASSRDGIVPAERRQARLHFQDDVGVSPSRSGRMKSAPRSSKSFEPCRAAGARRPIRSKAGLRRLAAEPAFHLEAVAHVEAEQGDVRGARSELERLRDIEAGIELARARLGREE